MTARPTLTPSTDPDVGIPDLIRRLTDDSKRLVADEIQLAKLEVTETTARASRGALWLAVAFGAGIVMLVALTLFLITLIGRLVNGHMWVGALVVGALEIGLGGWLILRGVKAFTEPSITLAHSRHALKDTANWASAQRR